MRNLFSVLLNIIAGFFFYMVSLLSFIDEPAMASGKWWVVLGFTIPALLFLCGGLALKGFRNWQRSTAIILLSSSGVTAFIVIMFASLLMSDEFRVMMEPGTLNFFSAYFSGGFVIVFMAVLGVLMLRQNDASTEQCSSATAEQPRR